MNVRYAVSVLFSVASLMLASCSSSDDGSLPGNGVPGGDPSGNPDTSILRSDNAEAILQQIVLIVNGQPFEQSIAFANNLLDAGQGLALLEAEPDQSNPDLVRNSYSCTNGGTYVASVRSGGMQPTVISGLATGCDIGTAVLTGNVDRLAGKSGFSKLEITLADGGEVEITGSSSSGAEVQAITHDLTINSFVGPSENQDFDVAGLAVEQLFSLAQGGPFQSLNITGEIAQPVTAAGNITLVTTVTFESTGSLDYFPVGTLVVTGSDGSFMEFNADTGDPATFSITVTDRDAITTSSVLQWSDQFRLPCITDTSDQPGLTGCSL